MTPEDPRPTAASPSPRAPAPEGAGSGAAARDDDPAAVDPAAVDLADLDHSPEEMAAMGRAVLDLVLAHQAALQGQPPSRGPVGEAAEELCRSMAQPQAPEHGRPITEVLAPFFETWVHHSFTTPGPGYLAYVPGGGLFTSVLAGLVAEGTNRYTGLFASAPPLLQLEGDVLRWLADAMGYPASARGLLTTGGSMANFSAIVTARETLLGGDLRDGVLYVSSQVHHCVTKSARMAGILSDRVRVVPVDERFRMRVDDLADAIAADRAAGLRPFLVCSSAGTTNTGAVDPLVDIGALCGEQGLWHHCDGAYGAAFHLVPGLHDALAGLPGTDSLTLDPHKGFFLPYGVGALLVREGVYLKRSHAEDAGYLPPPTAEEFFDPSLYGPELSRDYRGLRLWLPIQVLGMERFRAALAEKHALAVDCARRLAEVPGLVLDARPALSLFPFHLTRPGATRADEDRMTRDLMEQVTRRGRVMVSGCTTEGRYLGRVCVLAFRTRARHIDWAVEDIAAVAAELGAADG